MFSSHYSAKELANRTRQWSAIASQSLIVSPIDLNQRKIGKAEVIVQVVSGHTENHARITVIGRIEMCIRVEIRMDLIILKDFHSGGVHCRISALIRTEDGIPLVLIFVDNINIRPFQWNICTG